MFLHDYSPELNLIEEVFCTLKVRYVSLQAYPITNSVNIMERMDRVVLSINSELDFENYYNRMRMLLNKAFRGNQFY